MYLPPPPPPPAAQGRAGYPVAPVRRRVGCSVHTSPAGGYAGSPASPARCVATEAEIIQYLTMLFVPKNSIKIIVIIPGIPI